MQNISLSVTHSDNKINVKHNNRDFEEREWGHTTNSHINRDLSKYNTSFIQQDIKEAYQEAFGEALAEYNEKQKRKYLKIPDYYEYIKGLNDQHKTKKSKGGKATTKYNLQDEIIITIGNKDYWDDIHYRTISSINDKEEAERIFIEYKKKQSDEIFREFLKDFQAKHKHLHVFNAVAHYDEAGAPHMHLTFFGKAEGLKKGLRLQPRTTRAVAQDLDGDFYQKMLESDQKKYDLAKENLERKKQGLKPLQGDRKGDMSASANVYKQFLMETKQILIDKARELGLEYQATGTHDYGKDMDEFKETMAKRKEAIDKEVDKYKQQKQAEIKQLDEEISDKRTQAQEAGKTAEKAKETAKQAQKDAEKALQSKDEATREERIAKQKAEEAQAQADSFRKALERLKNEKEAQESELSELTEKVVDQNLELEEAKEKQEKRLAELESKKELLKGERDLLRDQVRENNSKISEQKAEISKQESKIESNKAFMEQQVKQHDEEINFIGRRTKALQGIEKASKVTYDEKGVFKTLGKVTMDQKHYENLKRKAGFFDSLKDFASDIVSTIQETSIYKALEAKMTAEVNKWKKAYQGLKAKIKELEDKVEEQNDELFDLYGERNTLQAELEDEREFRERFEKYLKPHEQKELLEKLQKREEQEQNKNRRNQGYWR